MKNFSSKQKVQVQETQKKSGSRFKNRWLFIVMMFFVLGFPESLHAHCDSFDGPVLKEAQNAVETGEVEPLLKWVDKEDEPEIVMLFNKTVALKNGDSEIFEIVKKHFFETLVRLHRESEGAPYTGLKPAGTVSPIVRMADQSIENGSASPMSEKLLAHLQNEVNAKFNAVQKAAETKGDSVEEGRAYVEAYVKYTHFLEAVHDVIAGTGAHENH